MNLTTDRSQGVSIVRVNETRLLYPLLSEFANTISSLIGSGEHRLLLDLSSVTYVDSATIGCLMDLYRQAAAAGGALKLAGVQKRVETMLSMTGAQDVLEIHADAPSAIKSFGTNGK
ncbi:MAG TPA: STAS domain-containing protein [Vicinamibacterales bacterium]